MELIKFLSCLKAEKISKLHTLQLILPHTTKNTIPKLSPRTNTLAYFVSGLHAPS